MFYRVEYLKPNARAKQQIVFSRYKSAATLSEMEEFAGRECKGAWRTRLSPLHNLHTDEVNLGLAAGSSPPPRFRLRRHRGKTLQTREHWPLWRVRRG